MLKILLTAFFFHTFLFQTFAQLPDGYPTIFKQVKKYQLQQNKMILYRKEVPAYDSLERTISYTIYGLKDSKYSKYGEMVFYYKNRSLHPYLGLLNSATFTFQWENYTFDSVGKLLKKDIRHHLPGNDPNFYIENYYYNEKGKLFQTSKGSDKYYFYYDDKARISEIHADKNNSNGLLGRSLLTYKNNYLISMRYQNETQNGWIDRAIDSFEYEGNIDTTDQIASNNNENQLIIFPNPFENKIRVKNIGGSLNDLNVLLFDLQGRKVSDQFINSISYDEEIELNFQGIVKGIYYLKFNDINYYKIVKLE